MRTKLSEILIVALLCVTISGFSAEEEQPEQAARKNRLGFFPRVGFNVSAKFDGVGGGGSRRATPNGDAYNYDNGYVLTDISGNQGGQTWYWGYDNSAVQVSGNNILLSRSTVTGGAATLSDDADPVLGGELVYGVELGIKGALRYGFEAAAGFQQINVQSSGNFLVTLNTQTDSYAFMAGATPPAATPSAPYQGTFQGPGFLISDMPSSTASAVTTGVPLSSKNELTSDLWTVRLGPYFEFPLGDHVTLELCGGVEGGLLRSTISWNDSAGSYRSVGEMDDTTVLVGFYVGAVVSWQFAERWTLSGGVQYHNLGTYEHSYRGRSVELDMNNAIFVTAGLSWRF